MALHCSLQPWEGRAVTRALTAMAGGKIKVVDKCVSRKLSTGSKSFLTISSQLASYMNIYIYSYIYIAQCFLFLFITFISHKLM